MIRLGGHYGKRHLFGDWSSQILMNIDVKVVSISSVNQTEIIEKIIYSKGNQ